MRFEKENLTYSPDTDAAPMDRLMFQMLGIFAEFERSIIDERRREGIAAAKAVGKRTHRPPGTYARASRRSSRQTRAGRPCGTDSGSSDLRVDQVV